MFGSTTLRRRIRLGAAIAALATVPAVLTLRAADHADAPDTTEGNLDINDLYVFNKGDDIVFAMTVSPLLTPGDATNNAALNPEGLYQFKLDVERDGIEDAVIQVVVTGTGPTQTVDVRGPFAVSTAGTSGNVLIDSPSIRGAFNTSFSGDGMMAFAGPRDDPFYIDLFGDESLTSVLNAAFSAALATEVGSPDEQTLAFADPATDDLAGVNTLAIVVQMPKARVSDALGISADGTFYAWATSSVRN